jgi:hypothetical protein
VEGHPDPGGALPAAPAQAGPLTALAGAFRAALEASDVRRARTLVAEAADGGAAPGRLYVEVVRPALAARPSSPPTARSRRGGEIGESILTELVGRLPATAQRGLGRAAVLSCRDHGIEAVDGRVAMDFLERDGWNVERLAADATRASAQELTRGPGVELAVAIVAGPEDALRLAPVCTALRRLPDPPVIILGDFSGRSRHRAAPAALGADAVADDPGELVRCASERLPGTGVRRWGVRLSRSGDTLVLAPTGRLDATSVERLTDVVLTRLGSFDRVVLDFRDLAEVEDAGVRALDAWRSLPALDGIELQALLDRGARTQLAGAGVALGWSPAPAS